MAVVVGEQKMELKKWEKGKKGERERERGKIKIDFCFYF